jgi:hypothetical protein
MSYINDYVMVHDFLLQAWKFASPLMVDILPGDRFLFTISSEDLVAKIMDNGPWNVKGALMVVKPWPPELTIDEVDLTSCSFWVQVHGLPLQNLTVVNVIKIEKFIGLEVLNVENGDLEGIIAHHHLRIRILISVLQPLNSGFYLPCLDLPSIWIRFQYERLVDYCVYCGLIGHRKFFFPGPIPPNQQELFVHTLRGYVYPGSRIAPSSPAHSPVMSSTSSLLCTEDLETLFQSHSASSHGGQHSRSLLIEPPQPMHGVTPPANQVIAPPQAASGFPYPYFATSHQQEQDTCPKGKAKISSHSGHADPGLDSRSMYDPGPFYPSGFGPPSFGLPNFSMGPSITGPILHGPTTQHSHTSHLQLAQQLTGVMGHSSLGLTLFGLSALHFYQGPTFAGLSLVPLQPSYLPSSHISCSIHVSQPIPSSSPLPHMMSLGSMDSPMHAPHPVSHTNPIDASPHIYTNPIISLPSSLVQLYTTNPPNLVYPTAPLTHKLSFHSSRSTTRHHPYQ